MGKDPPPPTGHQERVWTGMPLRTQIPVFSCRKEDSDEIVDYF